MQVDQRREGPVEEVRAGGIVYIRLSEQPGISCDADAAFAARVWGEGISDDSVEAWALANPDDASLVTAAVAAGSGAIVAGKKGGAPKAPVTINRENGNRFRHETIRQLVRQGYTDVGKEVAVKTPLGRRDVDILMMRNNALVAFETKWGRSRYHPAQRAKDIYINRWGGTINVSGERVTVKFPTMLVRGPR